MMKAVAFRSLFVDDMRSGLLALEPHAFKFDDCFNVAATSSIARELRSQGYPTIQISHLIDMVLYGSGLDERGNPNGPETAVYPSHEEFLNLHSALQSITDKKERFDVLQRFENQISAWQNQNAGRKIGGSIQAMTRFRQVLNDDESLTPNLKRALLAGRRDFSKAVEILATAGLEPSHLRPKEPIGEAAHRAWLALETSGGYFQELRRSLWIDLDEYSAGKSEASRKVRSGVQRALGHVFGNSDSFPLLQHGFRFFTSPQWAMFQLLEATENANQVFVIHDDGESDVFQTWRHYFTESWGFDSVQYVNNSSSDSINAASDALRCALSGQKVTVSNSSGLTLKKMQTCVSFVDECFPNRRGNGNEEDERPEDFDAPTLFAPNAEVLARLAARFVAPSQLGPVAFSTLPVGVFLIRLHECITETMDGGREVRFDSASLRDIVASGWLPMSATVDPMHLADCLGRAMPFFNGCRRGDEWLQRARSLRDLVSTAVSEYGERDTDLTDRRRISRATTNVLRLIPWVDLTPQEANEVLKAVAEAYGLVEQLIEKETHELKEFTSHLRTLVQQRLDLIPADHRSQFEHRITGLRDESNFDVYAEDLAEIVALLVAPPIELHSDNEDDGPVRGLSAVDRFAYRRSEENLHLTNLSSQSFPRQNPQLRWPFRDEDIEITGSDRLAASARLITLRADVSALSDLYLLWVFLNGVNETQGKKATLSYIAEFEREELEPSPVMVLLAEAHKKIREDDFRSAIADAVGGFPIEDGGKPDKPKLLGIPTTAALQTHADARASALAEIANEAVSSALVCPRRLALQWLAGPSAALSKDHLHSMLFGNMPGAMRERLGISLAEAEVLCKELFRNLTQGQQASSVANRRIIWTGVGGKDQKSASVHWLFTLGMSARADLVKLAKDKETVDTYRNSRDEPRGYDAYAIARWRSSMAYLAAQGNHTQLSEAHTIAARDVTTPLPVPEDGFLGVTARQCNNCPVAERCSVRRVDIS
jgi:hypothetical protein